MIDGNAIYETVGFFFTWWIIIVSFWKILGFVKVHWWPKLVHNRIDFIHKYGFWAVVTGSTGGIGKAYAIELAKRGMNIVLISRTQEKLNLVAEQIRTDYKVKIKTIQADFSQGFSTYKHIEKELEEIPVGILVNNVGMFFSHPLYFTEVPPKMIELIVNININSALIMTRIILPKMQVQRKGAIIFVSSITELHSHPLNTLYSSTKRFIRSFSEGLEPDCRKFGITVQRLTPSFVKTNLFSSFAKKFFRVGDFIIPNAETYAQAAVNTLGRSNVTCGFWAHELQYFVANLMPPMLSACANEWLALIFKNDYLRREKRRLIQQNSYITKV